jgi:hypothetical protein
MQKTSWNGRRRLDSGGKERNRWKGGMWQHSRNLKWKVLATRPAAPHVVSDGLLKFKRTGQTSEAKKTYNKPLAAESRNQPKAVISADDMMKDNIQAEIYGDRQRTKRKSSLHGLLQNIQNASESGRGLSAESKGGGRIQRGRERIRCTCNISDIS